MSSIAMRPIRSMSLSQPSASNRERHDDDDDLQPLMIWNGNVERYPRRSA